MIVSLVYEILFGLPVSIGKQMLEKMRDEIDKERLITQQSIKQKLQEIQLKLQDGELSEDEYEEVENILIARLKAVREMEKESG